MFSDSPSVTMESPDAETTRVTRRAFVTRLAMCGCAIPVLRSDNRGQRGRIHRIGLAVGDDPEGGVAAFREKLRELGYVDGTDLVIDAADDVHSSSATNTATALASRDLELLVVQSLPLALAARAANPGMRLVIVTTPGFITNGFAHTLDHPGGNATGIDELPPGVTARRLELLKAAAADLSRVALLSTTPGRGGHEMQLADAQEAAARIRVTVKPYRATSVSELQQALEAIASDGMNGLLNFQGGLSYVN